MNKRRFFILIMGLALAVASIPPALDLAWAGPGTTAAGAAATPSGGTFYANSPIIQKFVDSLPGVGSANANNLGQYIPVAVPDTTTYPGCDYYEIALVQYREQMHSSFPAVRGYPTSTSAWGGTLLRGYMQSNTGNSDLSTPHYLGPMIQAQKDRPVRITFTNKLPGGSHILPVDTTLLGAGMGPLDNAGLPCDPLAIGATCASYPENRAGLTLHGGFTPWFSAGLPHQWTASLWEGPTQFPKGAAVKNVPDMWFDATTHQVIPGASLFPPNANATNDPGPGAMTFYFPNAQTARMLFYHDQTIGISRLNVYAGELAPYVVSDSVEKGLVDSGVIPSTQIPLIIQDKTFVPQDISIQDARWDLTKWGNINDLWFPHVYETNQWPANPNLTGANDFGRWDYGPWFWPIFPVTADKAGIYQSWTSVVPESFMDTPLVNGTAYPYLNVDRKAYRFRILNASNDRFLNLSLFYADPDVGKDGTEVKMTAANPRNANELAADLGSGIQLYNGSWSALDSRSPTDMVYSAGLASLFVDMGANGVWQDDGVTWTKISSTKPSRMVASDSLLFVDFGAWGLWKWDGMSFTQINANLPSDMVASSSALYAYYPGYGIYSYDGTSWSLISSNSPTKMMASGTNLYVDFGAWGLWKYDGTTFSQINANSPQDMVASSAAFYASFGGSGIHKYDGTSWTNISTNPAGKMAASSWGTDLYVQFGGAGLWRYDNTSWTQIDTKLPDNMVAGSGLYCDYGSTGLWKYASGKFVKISSSKPNKMLAVNFTSNANWPIDGRAGGVPDPSTAGPNMIQIGNDGGIMPVAQVIPNQPVGYEYFRRILTTLNVLTHALYLGPGERADVVVDFSQVPAGSRLILYNDAPSPDAGFDTRYDYYTGNPDQTSTGGAPTTTPGYGPNTRTIMQFRVSNSTPATAFDLPSLQRAIPVAYANSQEKPIVAHSAYNAAYNTSWTDNYPNLHVGTNLLPTFDFTAGSSFLYLPYNGSVLVTASPGEAVSLPTYEKAIVEEMDLYGRASFQIGTEIPFTSLMVQTTIPFNYNDPASETIYPGEVQIWKIAHNGIETHPIHIEGLEMQLIDRAVWDNTIFGPDLNEHGWKDTIKMNMLETTFVAVRAKIPPTPDTMGGVWHSTRLLDPTQPFATTAEFQNLDPLTGQAPATTVMNLFTDFGQELVWGTMAFGHRDNNMQRAVILNAW